MKQRGMSSICRLICAATEEQTDRLGQTYFHVDQFYAFWGHVDVNLHLKFKDICAINETKKTHMLSLKIIFISLRNHTKGMHYATFQ